VPAFLPATKSPSIVFNLKSKIKDLVPQPVVEMEFDKSRNPSIISQGNGSKIRNLVFGEPNQLFTNGIVFDPVDPFQAEVFLNIDGVKRSFRYGFKPYPYGDPFSLVLKTDPHVEISDVKFTGDFKIMELRLEADTINSKAKLQAALWDFNKAPLEPVNFEKSELNYSFNTSRKEFVKVIQEKGSLALKFQACVDDWKISWNAEGLSGAKVIHAWLKDENGNILTRKSFKTVIDRTEPEKLELSNLPKNVNPGQEVIIQVLTSDRESGISKVEMSTGQSVQGKNVPAVKLNKNKDIPNLWEGKYLVPKDANGTQNISIVSMNGFGISRKIDASFEVVSTRIPTTGTIGVLVFEGGRKQPNLTVKLEYQKGKLIKNLITDDEGKVTFSDLQPGGYKVFVQKISSGRNSAQSIQLKVGDKQVISMELLQ
ncbi:MAG: hypothetical protein ACK47R_19165, partial [Planctomycetia bacterium]